MGWSQLIRVRNSIRFKWVILGSKKIQTHFQNDAFRSEMGQFKKLTV